MEGTFNILGTLWKHKMLCLSQKIVLLFTLKTISGLLASSARQDGDIQKIPTNVYSMNDKFTRFQFLVNVLSGTFLAPPPTLPSSFYNPLFYCVNFLIKLFLKNQRFSFASWEANFSGMDTVLIFLKMKNNFFDFSLIYIFNSGYVPQGPLGNLYGGGGIYL